MGDDLCDAGRIYRAITARCGGKSIAATYQYIMRLERALAVAREALEPFPKVAPDSAQAAAVARIDAILRGDE